MLIKESEGIQIGTKLLALRIQSSNETEALQALAVSFFVQFLFNNKFSFKLTLLLLLYFKEKICTHVYRYIYIYQAKISLFLSFHLIYCLSFNN